MSLRFKSTTICSLLCHQGKRHVVSLSPCWGRNLYRKKSTSARESWQAGSLVSSTPNILDWRNTNTEAQEHALSLKELVRHIPHAIHHQKEQGIKPGSCADALSIMMEQVQLTPNDLSEYAFFDTTRRYTRNLISTDHQTYTLLLLCWNPYQESPIHNHPCDGCFLRVIQGQIRECRYREATSATGALSSLVYHESTSTQQNESRATNQSTRSLLECTHDSVFEAGQLTFIDDTQGYHKVGPVGKTPAITLHLYTPPFQECRTWADPPSSDEPSVNYFL